LITPSPHEERPAFLHFCLCAAIARGEDQEWHCRARKDGEKVNDIYTNEKRGLGKAGSSPRQKECCARKDGEKNIEKEKALSKVGSSSRQK